MPKKQPIPNKPDFAEYSNLGVKSWFGSNYCALITWHGWVQLFNITESRIDIDLFTHKDTGDVFVAMSPDDRFCFIGVYCSFGLTCFDVGTGQVVWKRNDLRCFSGLIFSKAQNCLFCSFQDKGALRIDPQTGATLETFRGVKLVSASPFSDAVLFGTHNKFTLRRADGEKLWSVHREGFAARTIAWAAETIAISECVDDRAQKTSNLKSGIRCFTLHGELLWRFKGRWGSVSPLMYKPSTHQYVCIDTTGGKECFLVHLDEQTGRVDHEQSMPHTMHGEICQQGQKLFYINYETNEFTLTPIS